MSEGAKDRYFNQIHFLNNLDAQSDFDKKFVTKEAVK